MQPNVSRQRPAVSCQEKMRRDPCLDMLDTTHERPLHVQSAEDWEPTQFGKYASERGGHFLSNSSPSGMLLEQLSELPLRARFF